MSCAFDLGHYRELLAAAKTAGYRFASFEREPEPGDVFVRHDVDLSLDAALTMAEVEADVGAATTYLLMHESVFYNLASSEGRQAVSRLLELGHDVGVHAVWPNVPQIDERFVRVLAWHNPEPHYMEEPVDGFVNVMSPPWFSREHYRSDSNHRWRSGCPHEQLASGTAEWLQLLIHPEIWAYPGETMRATMLAMLDAERKRDLRRLAEDRVDLS